MRIPLLSIFFLLSCIQASPAQEIQGSVVYRVDVLPQNHFEDLKETNPDQYRQFVATAKRFENEVEQLNFILVFKGTESTYQAEDVLTRAQGGANSFGRAKGIFYNNQQTGERLQQVERNGKVFVIKQDELLWEITSEVKQIGEFSARKATTSINNFENQQSSGGREEAIAWFTTDIPIHFGPEGFSGLPGLIIELQVAGGRYYVDNMNLNQESIQIKKPSTQNLVTFDEYQSNMRNLTENYKRFHDVQ